MANYRDQATQTIEDIQKAIDETKKTDSIRRIERAIKRIDTEILDRELITGLDDLEAAIEEYKGIEREGLTPEEYRDEKESAFEAIGEAAEGLDIDEDALEDLEAEEKPTEPVVTVADCEAKHSAVDLRGMARRAGISPSGSKRELCRALIRRGSLK